MRERGCVFCGKSKDLEEHHLYGRKKEKTITVCNSCHTSLHTLIYKNLKRVTIWQCICGFTLGHVGSFRDGYVPYSGSHVVEAHNVGYGSVKYYQIKYSALTWGWFILKRPEGYWMDIENWEDIFLNC